MYFHCSGPGFFQKTIESILKYIKNVAIVADDLVVTGNSDEDHLKNLDLVLSKLVECSLVGRKEKCAFFEKEITYLGYKMSNNNISIDDNKYKAIVEMKTPCNHN